MSEANPEIDVATVLKAEEIHHRVTEAQRNAMAENGEKEEEKRCRKYSMPSCRVP
jgi:hypothetical protein